MPTPPPTDDVQLEYVPDDERRQLAEILRAALKFLEDDGR
jgi:hypothetical protein